MISGLNLLWFAMVKRQPPKWHGGGSDCSRRGGASSSTTATTKSPEPTTEQKLKPPSISHGKWRWMQRVRAYARLPSKPVFFKPYSRKTWVEPQLIKQGFYTQENVKTYWEFKGPGWNGRGFGGKKKSKNKKTKKAKAKARSVHQVFAHIPKNLFQLQNVCREKRLV